MYGFEVGMVGGSSECDQLRVNILFVCDTKKTS